MKRRPDYYAMHREIHRAELRELKKAVIDFGGVILFGADAAERPIVCVNLSHGEGTEDVYINAVRVNDGSMDIIAEHKEYGDPFILDPGDIEFGHVSFITDCVPVREDVGKPALVQ